MEPVSFAVGVVSLANLLDACVSAFERVNTYRRFGSTSRQLETRFENQKFLLQQWGARTGISIQGKHSSEHSGTDVTVDGRREERIRETLILINEELDTISDHFGRRGDSEPPAPRTSLRRDVEIRKHGSGKRGPGKPSHMDKLKWATGGKERLVEQVEWFENMVNTLAALTDGAMPPAHIEQAPRVGKEQGQGPPSAAAVESVQAWLNGMDSNVIREQCASCRTSGTCQWISTLPEYKEWLSPDSKNRTLWLHAPPGYGKSVTSSALEELLEQEYPDRILSYFCSATQERLRLPTNILRFCLAKAVSRRIDFFWLVEQSKHESDSEVASETELWSLFAVMAKTEPGFFIIVDGFDECHEFESEYHRRCGSDRGSLLRKLRESVADTPSRVVILSRDEEDIRSALDRTSSTIENGVIEYQIRQEDVQADIERFAAYQVDSLRGLAKRKSELRYEVIQHLIGQSDGMFLWVRLQSQQLTQTKSVAHLRNQMANMPPGLDNFYERDWKRIQSTDSFERNRTLRILRWVTFAVRPLTTLELFEAIAIQKDGSGFELSEDSMPEDKVDGDIIQSRLLEPCKPFVVLRKADDKSSETVQLAHFTMKTFLLAKLGYKSGSVSSDVHDPTLAEACIGYLSAGLPWTELDVPDDRLRGHPFLSYAVRNWMLHLDCSQVEFEDAMIMTKTWFAKQNCFWPKWRNAFESYLNKEGPVYSVDDEQNTPVEGAGSCYYAASFGLLDVLKTCLADNPAKIDNIGGRYGTALQAACANGHLEIVQFLLESGTNVNNQAGLRGCALNAAAGSGHENIVEILLLNQADPMVTDNKGRHALYIAAIKGHANIVKWLVKAGALLDNTNKSDLTPLNVASSNGHQEVVEAVTEASAHLNKAANDGWTPMLVATSHGHVEVVKLLLEAGCDKDRPDANGWTPIYAAACIGCVEAVKLLLEAGCDKDRPDTEGFTPLHTAADNGYVEVVKLLLEARCDKDRPATNGWTPINVAARYGHVEVTQLLLEAGGDIHAPDNGGATPVYLASQNGNLEILRLLLNKNANINVQGGEYGNALQAASYEGHKELVQMLLDNGANVNAQGGRYGNALYAACMKDHDNIVQLLLGKGAIVMARASDVLGRSLVHFSAMANSCHGTKHALKYGSSVDMTDNQQWTALHWCAYFGSADVTRLLLQYDANLTLCDWQGWTPYQVALFSGHTEIADILLSVHGVSNEKGPNTSGQVLRGQCNSCGHDLVEFQYHCTVCPTSPGFDLCFRCIRDVEACHSEHAFVTTFRYGM